MYTSWLSSTITPGMIITDFASSDTGAIHLAV
jgi:hypothetical protein